MTDLMKRLPTDITRLVWEFVGNDILQTPTGKIMKTQKCEDCRKLYDISKLERLLVSQM